MGQVLYRKYRSKSLPEILGQEPIVKALGNAISSGKLSHAYLFTGPRGVGKTSTARILAHLVNELPYDEKTPNIDIIEIDAASNGRIDEIRNLLDKVYITPTRAKYKVYIIDEVHMLSIGAFNALLKTLEEPPEHVIFILATTEVNKLPETIISRTQRYNFKPISIADIKSHLASIAKNEKVKVSEEALELIAEKADGSFRDSISLFDQITAGKKDISEEDVLELLGIPPKKKIESIINLLDKGGSYKEADDLLREITEQGYSSTEIAKNLMNSLRNKFLENELSINKDKVIKILDELIEVAPSIDSKSKLELVVLSNMRPIENVNVINQDEKEIKETKINEANYLSTKQEIKKEVVNEEDQTAKTKNQEYVGKILEELKKKHNTIYGIINTSTITTYDGEFNIELKYPFHQKKIEEPKNKEIIIELVKKYAHKDMKVVTTVNNKKKNNIEKINKVFGETTNEDID